jgi:pimeloyl-ACP methyl ester carboxylesterase
MAERADAIFGLIGVAGLNRERAIGDRKAFRSAIKLGVGTGGRKHRTKLVFDRHALNHRSGRGGGTCGGGQRCERRAARQNGWRPRHAISPAAVDRRIPIGAWFSYSLVGDGGSQYEKRVHPCWYQFCRDNPDDGDCQPNLEFTATFEERAKALAMPEFVAEVAHAGADHTIPGIRPSFTMAPATIQALNPASLSGIRTPVYIMLGDADTIAPARTCGLAAAAAIPNGVSLCDFLSMCTDAGRANSPACASAHAQAETHRRTTAAAEAFFGRYLSGSQ